jgi:bifunctional UDP-N-acetylglucosamine pyrophosphorylase/glucosamine-1-phosphate N-acetyltransferase
MAERTGSARELAVLVLAAGRGTRMKSRTAKVLHPIAGRPMLAYPLAAAEALAPARLVVVVGRDAEQVRRAFAGRARFVEQAEQLGTGHAVLQAREALAGFQGDVLILYGDTPLLRPETLRRLLARKLESAADLCLLSAQIDVPGIVVRGADGRVARIVEATDATPEELALRERNTGVYLLDAGFLYKTLERVGQDNAQGEIYLTGIVELAVSDGCRVEALTLEDAEEALGVNTRVELARATAAIRRRVNVRHQLAGVTIVDPESTWIDADVEIGPDTLIEPGCVIQGPTRIGSGVHVKPHCTIESSRVGDEVEMGPCAHLRPGTVLGRRVRIGNFVEVKNSTLGDGTKADHLSYIGDADVGAGASFGCGAVVVNYDGRAKHRTRVGERAFIGCNANLVAPIEIASDSFVAAGSTVTRDVPPQALAIARAEQTNVEGWVARRAERAAGAEGAAPAARRARKARRPRRPGGRGKPRGPRKPGKRSR